MDEAAQLAAEFESIEPKNERFAIACREGLKGYVGRPRSHWARDLVNICVQGLERYQPESRHLMVPLESLLEAGESPAEAVRRGWIQNPRPESFLLPLQY